MKILGFDSWTGGFRNYKRLDEDFVKNGIKFKLVHISSWSNIEIKEKHFGNTETLDISNYRTIDFDKILKKEKPDALVMLSVDVFAHKSMIRACRRQGVPVIHLFHGIMTALSVNEKVTYSKSFISKIKFALPRVVKYLRFIIPNYFISVYRDNISLKVVLQFLRTLIKQFNGKNILKESSDSKTDLCLVFSELDAEYAIKKYGYSAEDTKIVGNPDLFEFSFLENHINSYSAESKNQDLELVLYLDSIPYLRGFMTKEENLSYLLSLNAAIKKQGKRMAIKLHPEHKKTDFNHRLKNQGVIVVGKDEFINCIYKSEYIISEATSIFQIPALMGAPIYLSNVGAFKKQKYGELLMSYPNSYVFNDFILLGQLHNKDVRISDWINDNVGPLPFNNFSYRVVDEFINLINEKGNS